MYIKLILTTLAVSASLSSATPTPKKHSLPAAEYLKQHKHSGLGDAPVPGKHTLPTAEFLKEHAQSTFEEAHKPEKRSIPSAIKFVKEHEHSQQGEPDEIQGVQNPFRTCISGNCSPPGTDITHSSKNKYIAGEDYPALHQPSKSSPVVYNPDGECIIGDCPCKRLPGYPKSGKHGKKDKKEEKIAKLEARLTELIRQYESLHATKAFTDGAESRLDINDVEDKAAMKATTLYGRPEIHTVPA